MSALQADQSVPSRPPETNDSPFFSETPRAKQVRLLRRETRRLHAGPESEDSRERSAIAAFLLGAVALVAGGALGYTLGVVRICGTATCLTVLAGGFVWLIGISLTTHARRLEERHFDAEQARYAKAIAATLSRAEEALQIEELADMHEADRRDQSGVALRDSTEAGR